MQGMMSSSNEEANNFNIRKISLSQQKKPPLGKTKEKQLVNREDS